mmetsp:Transcript_19851/g.24225  ORF Transcript_19851/g.24225 Transcript_19851/m.24225 type:complete len:164 (-) Transcript_19851:386-877(-)
MYPCIGQQYIFKIKCLCPLGFNLCIYVDILKRLIINKMASALDLSVIDALPYVDTLIDENPQARADAESLIRKEMKRFDPTAHYEETLGPLYVPTFCGSTLLQKEFSRVVSQKEQKGGAVNEPLKAYVSNILEIPVSLYSLMYNIYVYMRRTFVRSIQSLFFV